MMTSNQIHTQMNLAHAIEAVKREIKQGNVEFGKEMLAGLRSTIKQLEDMLTGK